MRILHVGKYYPPYLGGMETVLENLVLGLLDAGHDVSVLVAGQSALDRSEAVTASHRSAHLTRLATLGVVNSQPLTPGIFSALRREIQRFQPDLVHLHLPNPLLALAWLALAELDHGRTLPPVVVWHHADITRQKLGRALVRSVVRRCLNRAAGICASSSGLVSSSRDLACHQDKLLIIPFGILEHPWSTVASTFDGPFLFIGRLVPYKGLEVLVKAMAEVSEGELVLVGDGPFQPNLASLIEAMGLTQRIRMTGVSPQKEILDIMGQARALVLPSLDSSETFGLVQLEAMAAGLPVLATDIPTGVREVGIPQETCLLTPPGDIEALAASLNQLQADEKLCRQLGERGRMHFQANYSRGKMIESLLAWYEEIHDRFNRV